MMVEFLSRLGSLLGSSPIDEQLYDCDCGAPMENTAAHTKNEYRKEFWQCTGKDCHEMAEVYLFENESESYGTGPLKGQVTGESK